MADLWQLPMKNYIDKKSVDNIHFRHCSREWAMQFLFQNDINSSNSINEAFSIFLEQLNDREILNFPSDIDDKIYKKAVQYAKKLVYGVIAHKNEIDKKIEQFSKDWSINRMDIIDRNLLRIAIYEMLFCTNIPPIVSIDEAVEIGKIYGTPNSASFINGILNSIKDTLDRPSRVPIMNSDKGNKNIEK